MSAAELGLVDKTADLTGLRQREVVTSALTVYQWLVGRTLIANTVAALKPSGEAVALENVLNEAGRSRRPHPVYNVGTA